MEDVRVVTFEPQYAKAFGELNYEWIAKFYMIEEHDHEQLDDPQQTIIDAGGQIFFVLANEEVAGTVAMIKMPDDSFELAKMAVAPRFQGRRFGELLMEACIRFAKVQNASRIILESNTKQQAAIGLYRKSGFIEIPLDPNSQFVRANIRMELAINGGNE